MALRQRIKPNLQLTQQTIQTMQSIVSSQGSQDLQMLVAADDGRNYNSNNNNSNCSVINPQQLAYQQHVHQQHHQQQQQLQLQQGSSRQQPFIDMGPSGNISQDWLDTICRRLINDMDEFGICVIDNFLGPHRGDLIYREVLELYTSGQYTSGKVSSDKLGKDSGAIRSDRVIWIDGCEPGCSEINNLIQTLCSVITNSSRLSIYSNNGLDRTVINKRTKAHVACYPGNGTKYIKHVDNPNGDGRVITSIYYLNKNWNTIRDGGLLRMFPAGMDQIANIEPLFDRALFFWSDRRNPHEVLPAYRDRYAITVWYIGEPSEHVVGGVPLTE